MKSTKYEVILINIIWFLNVSFSQYVRETKIYYLPILILGHEEKGVKCLLSNSGFAFMQKMRGNFRFPLDCYHRCECESRYNQGQGHSNLPYLIITSPTSFVTLLLIDTFYPVFCNKSNALNISYYYSLLYKIVLHTCIVGCAYPHLHPHIC